MQQTQKFVADMPILDFVQLTCTLKTKFLQVPIQLLQMTSRINQSFRKNSIKKRRLMQHTCFIQMEKRFTKLLRWQYSTQRLPQGQEHEAFLLLQPPADMGFCLLPCHCHVW